jgi:hypothetical protein
MQITCAGAPDMQFSVAGMHLRKGGVMYLLGSSLIESSDLLPPLNTMIRAPSTR